MGTDTDTDPDLVRLRADAASAAPDALFRLGAALVARQQTEEAFAHYRRAAEAGHAYAQLELARMLLYGIDREVAPRAAVEWLQRAEQAGNALAGYYLALIALGDIVLERDYSRIGQRLLDAARAGFNPARRALALYFGRMPGIAARRQSELLLAEAARAGDAVSAALLAARVEHGEIVTDAHYDLAPLRALATAAGIPAFPASLRAAAVEADPTAASAPLALDLAAAVQAPPAVLHRASPRIATIDGLLNAEECRYIIAVAAPGLKRASVVDPRTAGRMQHPIRTSFDATVAPLQEDFALRLLQLRMAAAIGIEFTDAEPLILLRYQPGEEYRPHRDYLPHETLQADRIEAGQRATTLCCYLGDVDSGGGTAFPEVGLVVEPRAGRAVAFRNIRDDGSPDPASLHAGQPVERGEKWVATLWLRQRRYRDY
jgi:hypothetical protein